MPETCISTPFLHMASKRKHLDQSELREWFDYDPAGFLIRRKKASIGTRVGQVAGCFRRGYMQIKFQGSTCQGHRMIWVWHHGTNPENIDHINRDPSDNRIENLRPCTHSQNLCNRKNENVTFDKSRNCWVAQVRCKGKARTKNCKTREEACAAAQLLRQELHGEFAHDYNQANET